MKIFYGKTKLYNGMSNINLSTSSIRSTNEFHLPLISSSEYFKNSHGSILIISWVSTNK